MGSILGIWRVGGLDHCRGLKLIKNTERGFKLSYESPKSENIGLFDLGERAYDHLLLLPTKSKGRSLCE